jgi:hypothetical protein
VLLGVAGLLTVPFAVCVSIYLAGWLAIELLDSGATIVLRRLLASLQAGCCSAALHACSLQSSVLCQQELSRLLMQWLHSMQLWRCPWSCWLSMQPLTAVGPADCLPLLLQEYYANTGALVAAAKNARKGKAVGCRCGAVRRDSYVVLCLLHSADYRCSRACTSCCRWCVLPRRACAPNFLVRVTRHIQAVCLAAALPTLSQLLKCCQVHAPADGRGIYAALRCCLLSSALNICF